MIPKKILVICDELTSLHLQTDTTYILMLTANELGLEVFYALPNQVYALNQTAKVLATKLKILATNQNKPGSVLPWYQEDTNTIEYLITDFAATFVRNNPPFNLEYYYLTQILTLAETAGARVINPSLALRNFNEKLAILNFPELIAPTIVTKHKHVINQFLEQHGECVIKPLDQMAGRGIFKISLTDVNRGAIIETSTKYYSETIMLQKFIPEVVDGDRRIFIVNGKVIPYALYRIPPKHQIRGNIASGGTGVVHELTPEDYAVAEPVAAWMVQHNIIFAGLDVIGNKLTEINITSPTGTRQILDHSGINISRLILEAVIPSD